ncbi:MAG: DUF885 domain-containing protein [Blautia sp.]|jgi:uncharacterized protein (DUF885 family)
MLVSKKCRPLRIALLLLLALFLGLGAGFLTRHIFSADARFESFTEKFFLQEVSGNTLNLHYTIAHPEDYGIRPTSITLGSADADPKQAQKTLTQYINTLKKFPYQKLSLANRQTYDMLLLYFKTELSLGDNYLLEEPLGPSLGIQAQLPVLLAEYTFYDEQDILDYLQLLTCIGPYFDSILSFEEKKAEAGFFMSDATLDRILDQCSSFLTTAKDSYLTEIFQDKLKAFTSFPEEKLQKYRSVHDKVLNQHVFPAYQKLMNGLEALRGRGKNPYGLCYFDHGREYYEYLLHSQSGVYTTVDEARERLLKQLSSDSQEMVQLLTANPALLGQYEKDIPDFAPSDALTLLQEKCRTDFPALTDIPYEVKYVHKSLEEFSSPAFYLTPPMDTNSPNTIYINRSNKPSNLELFTTLAHEGFPGHLYQTNYFSRCDSQNIRHLLSFGGYVEGWATYVESYAYGYSGLDAGLARLNWLNRSLNLCLYSLMDIGIHYYGWTLSQAGQFLSGFGIKESSVLSEIYQYIVETPGNYLKYYLGYLNFLDLKTEMEKKEGADFQLPKFHEKVLKIGPVQFPVLKKYIAE